MDETDNVAPLEDAIFKSRVEREAVKFDLLVRRAEVAEAKRPVKKAIELYVESIMALRHDSTPKELQQDRLQEAESRIVALGGTRPRQQ